jgi:hypothetical protein
MRLNTETPTTQTEREIETILINNGYRIEDIQFRETWNVNGPAENRYVRVGYWRDLPNMVLEQLGDRIKDVDTDYDDDCGCLYKFNINLKYVPKS